MTGIGAVKAGSAADPPSTTCRATAELLSIPKHNVRYDVVLRLSDAATAMLRRSSKLPHSGA